MLDRVRQLVAVRGEKFDAVVFEWIVGSRDHDAGLQAQGARKVGDRGRGHRSGKIGVHAGGGQSRLQGGFQHITGNARVLADQHSGMIAGRQIATGGEHLAGSIPEAHDEIGCDRRFADTPAYAVSTEIPSVFFHGNEYVVSSIARNTSRQSRVAATSCTRTMAAPRCAASNAPAALA